MNCFTLREPGRSITPRRAEFNRIHLVLWTDSEDGQVQADAVVTRPGDAVFANDEDAKRALLVWLAEVEADVRIARDAIQAEIGV